MHKRLLVPARVRQVPRQFSWIDQRLVRDHYLQRCDCTALALYLFLLTVADGQGLSYYADLSIGRLLSLNQAALTAARETLVQAGLIAFESPLYQVLALDQPAGSPTAQVNQPPVRTTGGLKALREVLQQTLEDRP